MEDFFPSTAGHDDVTWCHYLFVLFLFSFLKLFVFVSIVIAQYDNFKWWNAVEIVNGEWEGGGFVESPKIRVVIFAPKGKSDIFTKTQSSSIIYCANRFKLPLPTSLCNNTMQFLCIFFFFFSYKEKRK